MIASRRPQPMARRVHEERQRVVLRGRCDALDVESVASQLGAAREDALCVLDVFACFVREERVVVVEQRARHGAGAPRRGKRPSLGAALARRSPAMTFLARQRAAEDVPVRLVDPRHR